MHNVNLTLQENLKEVTEENEELRQLIAVLSDQIRNLQA